MLVLVLSRDWLASDSPPSSLRHHKRSSSRPQQLASLSLIMEGAALEDAEPIFELAVECERRYTEQIARLKEDGRTNDAAILSELYQRFAAWAAFLGVFAESKVCLDRRLRHHVEIQEQVLRLLDIMERNMAFGMACAVRPLGMNN
jgi:hypothetical protein